MKKKLVGLLTAITVLSMGMTAFAAESPKSASKDVTSDTANVAVYTASATTAKAAVTEAQKINSGAKVVATVDVEWTGSEADLAKGVEIKLNIPGVKVKAGYTYIILHQKDDGTWERIPVVGYGEGWITGKFTDLSPVTVIEVPAAKDTKDSPKTGSTLPVLPVLAMLCLAGVGVCGSKVKFNA